MPNMTLSIPPEIYERMKKFREVKWSEVARRAIIEYLEKLEKGTISGEEIIKMLGKDFREAVEKTGLDKYEEYYEKSKVVEWGRMRSFTTRTK
ncbi:MAG: hypothetical protein PWQ22_734 [Archaeoglobaceae archaeon]|nr:hypothetical protein [Archaeoglobaceae archaeon]